MSEYYGNLPGGYIRHRAMPDFYIAASTLSWDTVNPEDSQLEEEREGRPITRRRRLLGCRLVSQPWAKKRSLTGPSTEV